MQYLHPQISEDDLRAMAREASSLFLGGSQSPTDAVIKVASGRPGVTDQHVRRVCEMTYHDIFERSFRDSPGPDRLVSFDPPDATKVAAAVRATYIQSFQDKVASSRGGPSMDKTAEAPVGAAPAAKNAFLAAVRLDGDPAGMKKEARSFLKRTRADLVEAERDLRTQVSSATGSEKLAFFELARELVDAVRNGVPPLLAVEACVEFAKTAQVSDAVLEGLAVDLLGVVRRAGCDLQHEKVAHDQRLLVNDRHPLCARAVKVAELRGFKVHGEAALSDVLEQRVRLERELQDVLFQ